ncbi:hypothetical protein DFQ14_10337 [Halopolyspora algeriensis]|uniref:Uncharacterized protein n=1 Tax=Halopolyspora algeriensis TaxID=1500506 RepID=A0A368VUW1_9ACTN|nr:hypothetical protein [Halopolyspora algeriensis]RCW45076.1 hypothetical protein DFQ14_10337 [Halopolyspora algeriensis]TQM53199.1 hypothetical protein FHU43_2585 [Halopolyspora algeriensis]
MSVGLPTEKDAVEWPLIRRLEAMGWTHLPALTEEGAPVGRDSLRDVVLAGRLRAALHRINTLDGQPWLDDHRISQAANAVHRPTATNLLGTMPDYEARKQRLAHLGAQLWLG